MDIRVSKGMPGDPGVETVTFEATVLTTLTAIAFFDTIEGATRCSARPFEGATETWERLEEYLGTMAAA